MTSLAFDLFNWQEAEAYYAAHDAELESLWRELEALTNSPIMRARQRDHAQYMQNSGNSPEGYLRNEIYSRKLRPAWWYQYDRDVEAYGLQTRWPNELDDDVKALFPDWEEQDRRYVAYLDAKWGRERSQ